MKASHWQMWELSSRLAPRSRRRSGFTLLEVLLSSLIALFLLAALYLSMHILLKQTNDSRESLDLDNLARGVFNRMAIDLAGTLAPLPPKSGGNSAVGSATTPGSSTSSGSTSATGTASTSTGTAAATTAASTTAATTSSTDSSTTSSTTSGPAEADLGLQAGLIGTNKQLMVYVSRLPNILVQTGALLQTPDPSTQISSDLVRITYWLGQNGGLCRQERPWVLADTIRDISTPDTSDEEGDTLVAGISDLTFEYFDGTSWDTTWDGSIIGSDGVTPQGPPRAIRVTLFFKGSPTQTGGTTTQKQMSQIIPIRAAPGLYIPTLITPDSDPGTITPGGGASASSGSSGNSMTSGSGGTAASSGTGASGAAMSGNTAGTGATKTNAITATGTVVTGSSMGSGTMSGGGATTGGTGASSGSKSGGK